MGEKADACRELRTAGTEKSVPLLAGLLTDDALSQSARIALEPMPYPSAGAALCAAVDKTSGLAKCGVISSLGERRDPQAVDVIVPALQDKDLRIVSAAALALGKIGTTDAAQALSAARKQARGEARTVLGKGLVLCADRLLAAGHHLTAARTYGELSQPGEAPVVRGAALRGTMQIAGCRAAKVILESLAGNDTMIRSAAAGALATISLDDLRTVAAGMAALPPASQVAVLMAVRNRGDRTFTPVVMDAAKSSDATVRAAAARTLGGLSDPIALPLLLRMAAGPRGYPDGPASAARESLEILRGPRIDESIVAAVQAEKDPSLRVQWIGLLESRQTTSAVPALLQDALHPDPEVRSRAVAAWAKLAAPKDVPGMIAVVLKTAKGPPRNQVEKAVMLVCQQVPNAAWRAEPVLAAMDCASAADRAALLPLAGRIGGPAVRQAVQAALESPDPLLYEAGLRAICNWPDASVADQLLKLSQAEKSAEHRLWALRAFVRVAALPSEKPDAEKLAMLEQAMQLAGAPGGAPSTLGPGREEVRCLILQRAAAVRTLQTLRFVAPYLDQPGLAQSACKSVVELAHHKELLNPNKAEFAPRLKKVIAISKDPTLVELARRYLESL